MPSIPTLVAIADHFYVSLDYLTGRTDEHCYLEQYILKDEEHFTNDMLYNWLPTYYKEVALRRKNYTIEMRLKILSELKTSEILNKESNPNVIKAIFSEADNAFSYAEFSDYVITKMGLDIPQCKRYGKSGFERLGYITLYEKLLPILSSGSLLNQRLKLLREKRELTQAQVAEKLNIPKIDYEGYENKTHFPNAQTLTQLSEFFLVTVDYLLGEVEQKSAVRIREFYCRADVEEIEKAQASKGN